MATDNFPDSSPSRQDPALNSFAITPSDSVVLPYITRAIYIGVGGDVSLILTKDNSAVLFKNVVAGSLLPLRVKQVMNTNTTATNIVGVY